MKRIHLNIILAALAGAFLASCGGKNEEKAAPSQGEFQGTPVVLAPLEERDFTRYLTLKGTLEAKDRVIVSSRVNGTLEKVLVEEGDAVQEGQVLFRMDERTFRDQVTVAEATLAAQESAVEVARAQVEKAQASLHKATLDVERFRRLFQKGNVSANEVETYELDFQEAKADSTLAQANLAAQEAQVRLARASLSIARKSLEDCTVKALMAGRISARLQEPGQELGVGTPVVEVVDPTLLRAVASLPADYYASVLPGTTTLRLGDAKGKALKEVTVTDKSPDIQPGLRTFQVRGLFSVAPGESLVPGQLVDISVALEHAHGFAVPLSVPVRRSSGLLLYAVEEGKAKAILVQEGITQDGMVQVTGEGLSAGGMVVVEGQYMIQDGDAVLVK